MRNKKQLFIIVTAISILSIDICYAASFSTGDAVRVTENLNVRTGPGTSYPEITDDPDYDPEYAPTGTIGIVLSGPVSADGFFWWRINYGPGLYAGWSVEGGLEKAQDITLTLYVHEGSATGPVIVGANVSGQDSIGKSFNKTTNSSGYVTINGTPSGNDWQFSISKGGYAPETWSQPITHTQTRHSYMQVQTPNPPTLDSPSNGSHQNCGITFQWNSVSGATNYELSVKFPGSSSWTSDQTTSTSYGHSPTLIGLYRWKVKAYSGGNWSDYSAEWTFYFDGVSAPTLSSPSNSSQVTDVKPTFYWNSVSCANYYELQLARNSAFTDMVRDNLSIYGTSWKLDNQNLSVGQTYYWRVRSNSPIGLWSNVWHFTVSTIQYTLNASVVGGHGSVSPTSGSYAVGTVVMLTATPNTGYRVKAWSGTNNDSSTSNTNTVTMNSNKTATVEFEEIPVTQYALTASVVGGHGSVSPTSGSYAAGTVVTLTATPNTGYRVKAWNGTNNDSSTSNTNTVTMNSNKTVTVEFELIPATQYTLTTSVSPIGSGSINPSGGNYASGTEVTLTAYPDSGWEFDHWGGAASGTNTSVTITMNSNKNVTAYFVETETPITKYDLTISISGQGNTDPSIGTHSYNEGEQVTITAYPNPGWEFDHWEGYVYSNSPSVTLIMNSDKSLTAFFVEVPNLSPDPPTPISPGSGSEPGPVISTLIPTLQWEGVPDVDYYALAISEYPYGRDHIVYNPQQVYGTSHDVPIGKLEYSKKYRWNMQARNSHGWSGFSNTLYFQTPPKPTAYLTLDAPDEAKMGSAYDVYLEVRMGYPWPGGEVSVVVEENRGPIHAKHDIQDQTACTVYVFNNESSSWILTDNDYEFGKECILLNIPSDEIVRCKLQDYHQWFWIKEWNWSRVADVIINIGLDRFIMTGAGLSLNVVQTAATALGAQSEITYTYTAICEEFQQSDSTTVKVPVGKYLLLGNSMVLSIDGWVATTAAPFSGPFAPVLFALEAGCIISSEVQYALASDPPDFNYADIAEIVIPDIAELNEVDDPDYREATEKVIELAATSQALLTSVERYEGAKIDGRPIFMALQLNAWKFYAQRKVELTEELSDFFGPISSTSPIPTPEEIQAIRDEFDANGLPEIEKSILASFGYTPEDMDEIVKIVSSLPDEYFTSPGIIKDAMDMLVDNNKEYILNIPDIPEQVVLDKMNFDDLIIMASYWLDTNTPSCIGDLDGDCNVDFRDFAILSQHWKLRKNTPFGAEEDFEMGDFSTFNWELSGDADWYVTSEQQNSGMCSAKAGLIVDNQSSVLKITLDCFNGEISFYYKVSSESYFDYLKFYIDGVEKGKWSGNKDWAQVSFPVTAGRRTLQWSYMKDRYVSDGDDTAWIDDITFPLN